MRDYEGDFNGFAFVFFTKIISKDLLLLFFLCVYSCGIATFFIEISLSPYGLMKMLYVFFSWNRKLCKFWFFSLKNLVL
jgi:hypothetical protein